MKPVILLAAAQKDVDERFEWYAEQAGLELAIRFYLAFDAAVRSLSERPGAGAPRGWRTSRLRRCRSRRRAPPWPGRAGWGSTGSTTPGSRRSGS